MGSKSVVAGVVLFVVDTSFRVVYCPMCVSLWRMCPRHFFFHEGDDQLLDPASNSNIPGHTKNKRQIRAYKVLCALITLLAGMTKSVRMHEYATAFEFGHFTGHGCNQEHEI